MLMSRIFQNLLEMLEMHFSLIVSVVTTEVDFEIRRKTYDENHLSNTRPIVFQIMIL